jgi:hypothetical protein
MRAALFSLFLSAIILAALAPAMAQDDIRPTRIDQLELTKSPDPAVELTWPPVTLDIMGRAETIDHYKIYRGDVPTFIPDKSGGSNLIGTSTSESFVDSLPMTDENPYFYIVTAVDAGGNEANAKPAIIETLPVLSGHWTRTTIELSWTDAAPLSEVVGYRVYYGKAPGQYEHVDDVGLNTLHTLLGLEPLVNWYIAITVIDSNGNESSFSNEHIDALAGTVNLRVHDGDEICWGASKCIPSDPDKVQRNNGWQIMVPTYFPEGDWTRVTVEFKVESRLCTPPAQGTVNKCIEGNPCVHPPCNGGYNPCGDPWDRAAHLFLVLDDCIEGTGSCRTHNNLELIRAVTPFGTDALPPDGTGIIGERTYVMDITPYVPLLTGTKYVGAEIGHYVQKGWWVTVDFVFNEGPGIASDKPPADGIEIIGWGNAPLPTKQVSVPASATEVKLRLFTTGHGGSLHCDGGDNDALPCATPADCPGGSCSYCDEFCHRMNQIIIDGDVKWEVEPWRDDCSPGPSCATWNACGYPSCTYPRAGWCPGYIACHENAPCDNDLDFTTDLAPGGTYDIDYSVTPRNGSWPVSLVMFWYE